MGGQKASYKMFDRLSSTGGLATPVSMLIIFFSLTLVSTISYYYAVNRVDARKEDLKMIAAEEKMLDLEEAISSAAWSPGSARVKAFSDYGGELRIEPAENHLKINVTMGALSQVLFNSSTGRVLYELPLSSLNRVDSWLRGDQRSIVNRSSSYQAQVHFELGDQRQELRVGYRPLASSSLGGLVAGRRVNNVRIYIINLNGSEPFSSGGGFPLKVLCSGVSSRLHTYSLPPSVETIIITATLSGTEGTVEAPITSGPSGSTVRIEVLVCHMEMRSVSV
ncbi:MAG: hypothetical protein NWE79_00020 [Candidatus Bathyarchaeota archaeon]|nr:hypothetical protein [Candidatus Bathyarchaeota archaeon]